MRLDKYNLYNKTGQRKEADSYLQPEDQSAVCVTFLMKFFVADNMLKSMSAGERTTSLSIVELLLV